MSRSNKKPKKVAKTTETQVAAEAHQLIRRNVVAKSKNQQFLIDSIDNNTITFCEGPAGSGKTHVSIGKAVEYLRRDIVKKIILSRPIMQVDEDLGFLPGTADEKLHPFLLPLFDELAEYAHKSEIERWRNDGAIEICPLALMRGRSFHRSFVIVDEAQNCTHKQLQMALTRLGKESIMVVNGDSAQTDLGKFKSGALRYYMDAFRDMPNIGIVYLDNTDVVRNPLISRMLERLHDYEKDHPIR